MHPPGLHANEIAEPLVLVSTGAAVSSNVIQASSNASRRSDAELRQSPESGGLLYMPIFQFSLSSTITPQCDTSRQGLQRK